MKKKTSFQSITICSSKGRFYILNRSGDHRFQNVFPFKPLLSYTLQIIIAGGQPQCRPDVHPWATHALFSQYIVPETPLIPSKSVPECPILFPETTIFTLSSLELVLEPLIFFYLWSDITTIMWCKCPLPGV